MNPLENALLQVEIDHNIYVDMLREDYSSLYKKIFDNIIKVYGVYDDNFYKFVKLPTNKIENKEALKFNFNGNKIIMEKLDIPNVLILKQGDNYINTAIKSIKSSNNNIVIDFRGELQSIFNIPYFREIIYAESKEFASFKNKKEFFLKSNIYDRYFKNHILSVKNIIENNNGKVNREKIIFSKNFIAYEILYSGIDVENSKRFIYNDVYDIKKFVIPFNKHSSSNEGKFFIIFKKHDITSFSLLFNNRINTAYEEINSEKNEYNFYLFEDMSGINIESIYYHKNTLDIGFKLQEYVFSEKENNLTLDFKADTTCADEFGYFSNSIRFYKKYSKDYLRFKPVENSKGRDIVELINIYNYMVKEFNSDQMNIEIIARSKEI